MTLALLTVLLSVSAGAGLAFLGGRDRRHLARVVDSFSLVACLVVVLVHLLPHALSRVGLVGLVPFAAALLIPLYFERWAHQRSGGHGAHGRAALEIGYAGLLLHQVGDGLGLGTFASGAHEGHDHMELALAIFAHTVPVAAVVTLAFVRASGARPALLRAAGLAAAGAVGVGLAGGTPSSFLGAAEPWITAVVAGLLLHVITHDFRPEGGRGTSARVAELVALALGAGLIFLGEGEHSHGAAESFRGELSHELAALALPLAPAALIGLVVATLARALRVPMPTVFFEGTEGERAPELFFVTLSLAFHLFGWAFGAALAGAALALSLAAARVLGEPPLRRKPTGERGLGESIRRDLDLLFTRLAPWLVLGLVASTYASAGLADGALKGMGALGLAITGLLAFPMHLAGAGVAALLFTAVGKGLGPGAALVALLVGPATSATPPESSARKSTERLVSWGLAAAAIALGAVADATLPLTDATRWPRAVELASLGALSAATIWILVRDGIRAFVGALGEALGALPHAHDHDAPHGH